MNGAKFRLVGWGLLSGAALAVGCGGGDGGGGSGGGSGGSGNSGNSNTTATTSPVTTTIGNVTNNVSTASSSQSTNSTGSGTASGTSTGSGSGSTGSGSGSTTGGSGSNSGTTGSNSGTTGSATVSTGSATASTGSTTSSAGATTASTGSATASTGSATASATTSSTGSTTGSGGTGGTDCNDPAPTGGEGGAAGSDGGDFSGFNFVDESEVEAWSIMACDGGATNCVDEDAASVSFSCGVLVVEIDWPASANTQATRLQLQNVVPVDMLRDLSGKTLYARVRMTSGAVADHGYDFNVIAQDFIDDDDESNDWKWFSTCYNGSGNCPDNPSGETYAMGTWVELALPMLDDLAPDEFAFDSVRKLAFEIGTKWWEAGEPFNYDAAPATFEIDYVAW